MIEIKIENKNVVLSFPKDLISSKYIFRFIELLEMEKIAQKSELSEDDAWKLSEEIKGKWWEGNKLDILNKIENEDNR